MNTNSTSPNYRNPSLSCVSLDAHREIRDIPPGEIHATVTDIVVAWCIKNLGPGEVEVKYHRYTPAHVPRTVITLREVAVTSLCPGDSGEFRGQGPVILRADEEGATVEIIRG